jgi:hypothetical protein
MSGAMGDESMPFATLSSLAWDRHAVGDNKLSDSDPQEFLLLRCCLGDACRPPFCEEENLAEVFLCGRRDGVHLRDGEKFGNVESGGLLPPRIGDVSTAANLQEFVFFEEVEAPSPLASCTMGSWPSLLASCTT